MEQDLADALNSGKVYAAGAAQAARQRIMDIAVDNVKAFIAGNPANVGYK